MKRTIQFQVEMHGEVVKNVNVVSERPYKLDVNGKITTADALAQAICNGETYASLVYLTGGTNALYGMMQRHFNGTLKTLRKRWGVSPVIMRAKA